MLGRLGKNGVPTIGIVNQIVTKNWDAIWDIILGRRPRFLGVNVVKLTYLTFRWDAWDAFFAKSFISRARAYIREAIHMHISTYVTYIDMLWLFYVYTLYLIIYCPTVPITIQVLNFQHLIKREVGTLNGTLGHHCNKSLNPPLFTSVSLSQR